MTITLQDRVRELVQQHGGMEKAAIKLGINRSYLVKLRNGTATNPGDSVLLALNLKRKVSYEDFRL